MGEFTGARHAMFIVKHGYLLLKHWFSQNAVLLFQNCPQAKLACLRILSCLHEWYHRDEVSWENNVIKVFLNSFKIKRELSEIHRTFDTIQFYPKRVTHLKLCQCQRVYLKKINFDNSQKILESLANPRKGLSLNFKFNKNFLEFLIICNFFWNLYLKKIPLKFEE